MMSDESYRDAIERLKRSQDEVLRLRRQVDRLTACPGCGGHPTGMHFCPGPPRERYAWHSDNEALPLPPWQERS